MSDSPRVRWMIRRDMPETLAIEAASGSSPWDEARFLKYLRQRDMIGMVADVGLTVAGVVIYQNFKHKVVVHKLVVHPAYRRQGVGTAIVAKLVDKLDAAGRNRIVLRCEERRLDGLLFFKASGFRAVRLDREHYQDGQDAIVMRRDCVPQAVS